MSETGIQRTPITTASLFSNPGSYETLKNMATTLFVGGAEMGLIPSCVKTPQQALAGMLVLVGMGEDPLTGMQYLQPMPGGKVGLDYKFLMGVVERNSPGWMYEVEEQSDELVRGWFQAPGRPKYPLTYTYDQAVKSGVAKNPVWNNYRQDMLFKTWWLRGARRTAPLALRGVPVNEMLEPEDVDSPEASLPEHAAWAPAPAQAPAPKTEEPVQDYQKLFMELAAKHKFQFKGRGGGERLGRCLVELLKSEGVEPKFKSAAEVSPADWRLAYERLHQKYESGAEVVEAEQSEASTEEAPGTTESATPVGEGTPTPDADDVPPPSVDGDPALDDEKQGVLALEDQMKEVDFLTECANSLEFAWKEKGSVIKYDEKNRPWFTNREILTRCGFVEPDGASVPKALFAHKHPKYALTPQHTYALCVQVRDELAKAANGGRPVAAQRS